MLTEAQVREIEERAEKATPGPLELMRYDHGGGRLGQFGDGRSTPRRLVADFFHEGDREFYSAALADIPALIQDRKALVEALQHARWCRVCADGDWTDCEIGRESLTALGDK